jgi:hypothetical protein
VLLRSARLVLKLCAPLLALALAAAASAVIIDSGDGTGNVTAPVPDPGWSHVGTLNGGALTVVYLGSGWVLTANHVGAADVAFGGVPYPWVPGTDVQLHNPDDSLADLLMFRIYPPYPPLSPLTIATDPPTTQVILIGNGPNRGSPTTWSGHDGYNWLSPGQTIRWGTNKPQFGSEFSEQLGTWVITTVFDEVGPNRTTYEAQAGLGDSGGAVFAGNELAGTMIAIGSYMGQPTFTSLYGQTTYAADLSVYRDEIITTMPEPCGGLAAGVALVIALASAGTRRACRGTRCAASWPRRA